MVMSSLSSGWGVEGCAQRKWNVTTLPGSGWRGCMLSTTMSVGRYLSDQKKKVDQHPSHRFSRGLGMLSEVPLADEPPLPGLRLDPRASAVSFDVVADSGKLVISSVPTSNARRSPPLSFPFEPFAELLAGFSRSSIWSCWCRLVSSYRLDSLMARTQDLAP